MAQSSRYLAYSKVSRINLELTTKCNAGCPLCLRTTLLSESSSHFPGAELSLMDIKELFPSSFVKRLKSIYFCGNLGDAASARDIVSICKYLKNENPKVILDIYSNGGLRTTKWWFDLAQVVSKAHFAIDGLEDTNHLYRKNVDFQKAISNMKAFIKGGGEVIWDFLVFKHNQHQVEEVRQVAKEIGVKTLRIKSSSRFSYLDQKSVEVKPPSLKKYKNDFLQKGESPSMLDHILPAEGDSKKEVGGVSCQTQNEKSIFVSAYREVYPCCWLAVPRHYPNSPEHIRMQEYLKAFDDDYNTAFKAVDGRSIKDVLEGTFYEDILCSTWNTPYQLGACTRFCSGDTNALKSQYLGEDINQ